MLQKSFYKIFNRFKISGQKILNKYNTEQVHILIKLVHILISYTYNVLYIHTLKTQLGYVKLCDKYKNYFLLAFYEI